jgi:hypothetical protein
MNSIIGNFFFLNLDTSEIDYDYIGYINGAGKVLITRTNKEGTTSRYYLTKKDYENTWINRKNLDYRLPWGQ